MTGIVIAQLIAGYFGKGMYFGVLVLGAYLAYRVLLSGPTSDRPFSRRIIDLCLYGALILVLGALFGAVSLLPRFDFLQVSNLAGGSYEGVANTGSVEPPRYSLAGLLSMLISPRRPTYYLSGSVLILAMAGVLLARRRFAAPFFAFVTLAAMILTLKPTPFHRVMYLLPKFQDLHEHDPQIVLALATLGPALLAGSAVTMIEQRLASWKELVVAAIGPIVAAGAVYWLLRPHALPGGAHLLGISLLIGGLLLGLALLNGTGDYRSVSFDWCRQGRASRSCSSSWSIRTGESSSASGPAIARRQRRWRALISTKTRSEMPGHFYRNARRLRVRFGTSDSIPRF